MERDHEEVRTLLAAYALGAVAPEDMPGIRAHILSCDECMAEADAHSESAAALALAVDPAPLPRGFEERVLARALEKDTATTTTPVLSPAKRRWRPAPVLSAAAALIAVAVLAGVVVTTSRDLDDTRDQLARNERVLTALLHSEDGMVLQGPSGAVGRMVPTASGGYLVVAGLPQAPRNHAYQLWLFRDGEPRGAGVFDVSEGVGIVDVEDDLGGVEGAAVTIEPKEGSIQPTGDSVLATA